MQKGFKELIFSLTIAFTILVCVSFVIGKIRKSTQKIENKQWLKASILYAVLRLFFGASIAYGQKIGFLETAMRVVSIPILIVFQKKWVQKTPVVLGLE